MRQKHVDWAALLPANVTKEGGADIEDIAGKQNTLNWWQCYPTIPKIRSTFSPSLFFLNL